MTRNALLVAMAMAVAAIGQQPNTPQASLVINAVAGPPYPIMMTVQTDAPATGFFQGAANVPFALARSLPGQLQPGAATLFGGSFDLPLSPFPMIEHDGFATASQFHTNANGHANLPGSVPPAAAGTMLAYQAAIGDPLSPFGITLTAATGVTLAQNWTQTPLTLGDESSYLVNLPFPVPFYGVNYSQLYVYSNGYVTFGTAESPDYTPSNIEFNFGPPRLAGFWTDLDCPSGAVVVTVASASTPNAPGFVRVDYTNVHDYAFPGPTHTFSMQIHASGLVQIDHHSNTMASIYDQITGIGPGTNLSSVPQKDLSANATPSSLLGGVNETFFEWFGDFTMPYYGNPFPDPYDLAGKRLTFFPMGTGGLPQATSRYLLY